MTLPDTYQEVEYIESSGTQYINTGLAGTAVNSVEMSFSFPSLPPSDVVNLIGAREASSTAISPVRVDTSSKMIPRFGNGITTNTTLSANTQYTVKTNYTSGSQTVYVNDTQVGTGTLTWTRSNTYNIFIFGLNNNGSLGNSGAFRLYSCKMYNGTTLVRNFIPCYRKSDSVIGLYDLVNNTFYTNQGTGTFAKGPNVVPVPTYKLHGAIQTFHYQFSEPEREPNSNTIFYLPFTEDILDHSGNNHTLTANGSNYTFTTRSNGAKCMSLNNGGGTTYFSFSDAACKRAWNQSRSWGYKISDAVLQGSAWGECSIFGYNGQMKLCTLSQVTSSGYNKSQLKIPGGWDLKGSSSTGTTYDSSDVRATSSTEHTIVFTFDANTKTFKRYLDGVLFYENVFSAGPSQSASYCYICRDGYDTEAGRYLRAKISHIVYEDGVWDDNRIQLYTTLL